MLSNQCVLYSGSRPPSATWDPAVRDRLPSSTEIDGAIAGPAVLNPGTHARAQRKAVIQPSPECAFHSGIHSRAPRGAAGDPDVAVLCTYTVRYRCARAALYRRRPGAARAAPSAGPCGSLSLERGFPVTAPVSVRTGIFLRSLQPGHLTLVGICTSGPYLPGLGLCVGSGDGLTSVSWSEECTAKTPRMHFMTNCIALGSAPQPCDLNLYLSRSDSGPTHSYLL